MVGEFAMLNGVPLVGPQRGFFFGFSVDFSSARRNFYLRKFPSRAAPMIPASLPSWAFTRRVRALLCLA